MDRRKPGSKHTLLVDRHGIPLAIRTAGTSTSEHTQIIPLVEKVPSGEGSRFELLQRLERRERRRHQGTRTQP